MPILTTRFKLAASVALCAPIILPHPWSAPRRQVDPPPVIDQALVEATCAAYAARLGSLSVDACLDSRLVPTGARSVMGEELLVREFPPLPARRPLGRVLLFGGIHGDELSSASIVFNWIETLNRFHSGLFHWRISPVLNPDGLLQRPAQRMNANGVDLNRNFPTPGWQEESADYWVRRTGRNPRRYPGNAPVSEPEVRWLVQEIERFRPDVIVSVHAPHHVVDYDGPPEPPERLGSLYLKLLGTYPGSLGRFAGVHRDIPVVTIELPSAGIMPSEREQEAIWMDLIRWLKERLSGTRVAEEGPAPEQLGTGR